MVQGGGGGGGGGVYGCEGALRPMWLAMHWFLPVICGFPSHEHGASYEVNMPTVHVLRLL